MKAGLAACLFYFSALSEGGTGKGKREVLRCAQDDKLIFFDDNGVFITSISKAVGQEDNCFEGKKRVAGMKRRAQDSSMNTQTEFAPMNVNAEQAWQKVLARDAAADGAFVYAVGSTGIYCRPSCPSKRPIRQVVSFYPSPADARAAGFRACRRCRTTESLASSSCRQSSCCWPSTRLSTSTT